MTTDNESEAISQKHGLAIQELSIRIEALNHDVANLFEELEVTPEQVTAYISDQNNFTQSNWNALLEQRKMLDEQLMRALINVADLKKTKQTYASRNVPSHWLFVR